MAIRSPATRKIIQGVVLGLLATILSITGWQFGWLDSWEAETWDWRVSITARPSPATDEICLILLDQQSLDWGKNEYGWPWPWPREVIAAIIDFCRRSNAKGMALDVLYTEPSAYGVNDDRVFGRAIDNFPGLVSTLFLSDTVGSQTRWPENIEKPSLNISGLKSWPLSLDKDRFKYGKTTFPIDDVAKNSDFLGNIHLDPDRDGVYREIKPFGIFDGQVVPALALALYLSVHPEETVRIEPGRFALGDRHIPLTGKGGALLRYRGPTLTHPAYSAAAVIQSEILAREGEKPLIDTAVFRDKYVMFGYSAPGLFDLRPAPVGGVYSGVEIHATMLDNLLVGDFFREVSSIFSVLLILVLSLSCALAISRFTAVQQFAGLSVAFLTLPVVIALESCIHGYRLPLMAVELAVIFSILFSLAINYMTEGRQKRFIKNAFQQYISPDFIEQLIQKPELLKLGGRRRELSIFFSDLQGFTSISEKLDPEKLTELLNDYLTAMTDIIIEEKGTVDKYEGDAIIAFWNAPLDVPDHGKRAVRAALRCQEVLAGLRPEFEKRFQSVIKMRIGLNSGFAVVGNFGSHTKFDYTMLGDAVNLAARLEGTNKQFGTYTMISEFTRALIGDRFFVREIGRVMVVGKKEPVTVFEPMGEKEFENRKKVFQSFDTGLRLFYEGNFQKARDVFFSLSEVDPASESYLRYCEYLMKHPPGDGWQGIWLMESK